VRCNLIAISVLCVLSVVLLQQNVVAQNRLVFDKENLDLGEVLVDDSVVVSEVKLYNRSIKPLIISKIISDCGCLKFEYSKKPIKMGETLRIKLKFDPNGQSGRFYKPVYVYHNQSKNPEQLIVRGVVKVCDSLKFLYPYELMSGCRVTAEEIHLGLVGHKQTAVGRLGVYNTGNESIVLSVESKDGAGFKFPIDEIKVGAGQQSVLNVEFTPRDTLQYGTLSKLLKLSVMGKSFEIPISAIIVEDFSQSNAEAPQLVLEKQFFYLKNVAKGDNITLKLKLYNKGDNDLIIRKINVSDGALNTSISKSHIKPREKAELQINLQCGNDNIKINESVELICNDPIKPMREIRIVANVSD
jgi:hypothetical protein